MDKETKFKENKWKEYIKTVADKQELTIEEIVKANLILSKTMQQNNRLKEGLTEEGKKRWAKFEKLYKKVEKMFNNSLAFGFVEEAIALLGDFVDSDTMKFKPMELTEAQEKTIDKLMSKYEKIKDKANPQLGAKGEEIYYSNTEPEMI